MLQLDLGCLCNTPRSCLSLHLCSCFSSLVSLIILIAILAIDASTIAIESLIHPSIHPSIHLRGCCTPPCLVNTSIPPSNFYPPCLLNLTLHLSRLVSVFVLLLSLGASFPWRSPTNPPHSILPSP